MKIENKILSFFPMFFSLTSANLGKYFRHSVPFEGLFKYISFNNSLYVQYNINIFIHGHSLNVK